MKQDRAILILAGAGYAACLFMLSFVKSIQESIGVFYRVPAYILELRALLSGILIAALGISVWVYAKRKLIQWKLQWKIIVCFFLFFCAVLLYLPPLGSEDVFLYIGQGRIAAVYHQNPYLSALEDFPGDIMQNKIYPVWKNWKSAYGPAWTAIEFGIASIGKKFGSHGNTVLFRMISAAVHIASVWMIYRVFCIIQPLKKYELTFLYAWNPLLLFEMVNNSHNESFILFFLITALYLLLRQRIYFSTLCIVFAGLIKYPFLLLLPVLWVYYFCDQSRNKVKKIFYLISCAFIFGAVICLPWWHEFALFQGLKSHIDFSSATSFPIMFSFIASLLSALRVSDSAHTVARISALALFFLSYILVLCIYKKKLLLEKKVIFEEIFIILTAIFFFLTPNSYAWYYAWLLPFALMNKNISLFLLISLIGIASYVFNGFLSALLFFLFGGLLLIYAHFKKNIFMSRV